MADHNQNPLLPALDEDEQFVSSENFLTAETALDWDALVTRGNANNSQQTLSKWERDSLYVKFDPLIASRKDPTDRSSFIFKAPAPKLPAHLPPPPPLFSVPVQQNVENINGNLLLDDSASSYTTAVQSCGASQIDEKSPPNGNISLDSFGQSPNADGFGDAENSMYISALELEGLNNDVTKSPNISSRISSGAEKVEVEENFELESELDGEEDTRESEVTERVAENFEEEALHVDIELPISSESESVVDNCLNHQEATSPKLELSLTSHFAMLNMGNETCEINTPPKRRNSSCGSGSGNVEDEHEEPIRKRGSALTPLRSPSGIQDLDQSLHFKFDLLALHDESIRSSNHSIHEHNPPRNSSSNHSTPTKCIGGEGDFERLDTQDASLLIRATSPASTCGGVEEDIPRGQMSTPEKFENSQQAQQKPRMQMDHPYADKLKRIAQLKENIAVLNTKVDEEKMYKLKDISKQEMAVDDTITKLNKMKARQERAHDERELTTAECNEAKEDLIKLEARFTDMLMLYEAVKNKTTNVERNLVILQKRDEILTQMLQKREALNQATHDLLAEALEKVQLDFENRIRERDREIANLKAKIRLCEVKINKLEGEIEQVNRESDKLRNLCEDLMRS